MRITVFMMVVLSTGCAQRAEVAASSLSHRPDSATELAILSARNAVWRAWFANDTAQLERSVPEALAEGEFDGSQLHWGDREQAMSESRQFVAAGGTLVKLDFPYTEIHVMGNLAVVMSVYDIQVTTHGAPHALQGHSTEIFVLRNGHWENPFWHLDPSDLS